MILSVSVAAMSHVNFDQGGAVTAGFFGGADGADFDDIV